MCGCSSVATAAASPAVVGVDAEVGTNGSVRFSVQADGTVKTTTAVLHGGEAGVPVSVDVSGIQWLDLVTDDGGDGNTYDHVDWADATLVCR